MPTRRSTSDVDIAEVLETLNKYISHLAQRKVPRYVVHLEELNLEIDELAQQARIKLWQTSHEKEGVS